MAADPGLLPGFNRVQLFWRDWLSYGFLATHEFPFEQAADAYACVDRKQDGLIHAALRYQ
jgi:hypothetical protein